MRTIKTVSVSHYHSNFLLVYMLTYILLACVFFTVPLHSQEDREDALLAFRERRYEDAIRITTQELSANPSNMNAYAVQGWALLSLGRWTDAIDSAQQGLEVSRFDHRIIAIMAEAQYGLTNYTSALSYLQDYAALRPNGSIIDYIYQLMGEIHLVYEEYHLADIAFTTSLYFEPGNIDNWLRLGFAREQSGDSEYAIEAYENALNINASLEQAQLAISRLQGN